MNVSEVVSEREFIARIQAIHIELGIGPHVIAARGLQLQPEPKALVSVCIAAHGGSFELTAAAAHAWLAMNHAAQHDGVSMALVSAYRSVAVQREIIRTKLARGDSIEAILASVAPPGYSEHHTGRAIDIGTSEDDALEEVFETTPAYAWLQAHAHDHGFVMSYPKGNPQGFVYEPWHWCYCHATS